MIFIKEHLEDFLLFFLRFLGRILLSFWQAFGRFGEVVGDMFGQLKTIKDDMNNDKQSMHVMAPLSKHNDTQTIRKRARAQIGPGPKWAPGPNGTGPKMGGLKTR